MADADKVLNPELADLLGPVARMLPVPAVVTDASGGLLAANPAWEELCGGSADPARPGSWAECLDPVSRRRLRSEMERVAERGEPATVELEMQLPGGARWTRWWLHRRRIDTTPVLVLVAIDVHEETVQRQDLRHLATRDDLTGLVNRRCFLETVEQALRRIERFPEPAALLYIDLDHFKTVNDRAGHAVGDRVLAAVAARLDQAVRGGDVVGRIGGDEFAVLIERMAAPGEAAVVARRIQESLGGTVEVDGRYWPIAASVGIAMAHSEGDSAAALLARADQAMYAAKRGRGAPPVDEPLQAPAPEASGDADEARDGGGDRPTLTATDLHLLRDRMDTVRRSLQSLLEGLEAGSA